MSSETLLHQTREQTRWYKLDDGVNAAVHAAAEDAARRGIQIPAPMIATYREAIISKYGERASLHVAFYENDGLPHLAIAGVRLISKHSPQKDGPPATGSYHSRHLGTMQVSSGSDPGAGAVIRYRTELSHHHLHFIFAGPPGTIAPLAYVSHQLVDDFALAMSPISA